MDDITRKDARYWMFRYQNEMGGGAAVEDDPKGLRQHFEDLPFFPALGGWKTFAQDWDLPEGRRNEVAELIMTPRDKSIHEEWFSELLKGAKELPEKKTRKRTRVKLDPARNSHGNINVKIKKH